MKIAVTIAHGDQSVTNVIDVPAGDISHEGNAKRVRRRIRAIERAHPRAIVSWQYVEEELRGA